MSAGEWQNLNMSEIDSDVSLFLKYTDLLNGHQNCFDVQNLLRCASDKFAPAEKVVRATKGQAARKA